MLLPGRAPLLHWFGRWDGHLVILGSSCHLTNRQRKELPCCLEWLALTTKGKTGLLPLSGDQGRLYLKCRVPFCIFTSNSKVDRRWAFSCSTVKAVTSDDSDLLSRIDYSNILRKASTILATGWRQRKYEMQRKKKYRRLTGLMTSYGPAYYLNACIYNCVH